jgi:hypothetical protein
MKPPRLSEDVAAMLRDHHHFVLHPKSVLEPAEYQPRQNNSLSEKLDNQQLKKDGEDHRRLRSLITQPLPRATSPA